MADTQNTHEGYHFTIRMADCDIAVHSMHPYVRKMCEDYIIDAQNCDFAVEIVQENIDYEREQSRLEDEREGLEVRSFSDEYLETLAVYRKIAKELLNFDTVLFHGSVLEMNGEAVAFTAVSGTGKSTHARLWRERFGDAVKMINDDKPLIKLAEDKAIAYGTPWCGKHWLNTNTSAPLRAICILERAEENSITEISFSEAFTNLYLQTYRPKEPALLEKTLALLDRYYRCGVKFYRLGVNMDISAADCAYEGIFGEK